MKRLAAKGGGVAFAKDKQLIANTVKNNILLGRLFIFTKCTVCVHIKDKLVGSNLDQEQRKRLCRMRKICQTQQM